MVDYSAVDYSDGMIKTPIVIDNVSWTEGIWIERETEKLTYYVVQGTGVMKAGLGGEEKPALVFNTQ